MSVYTSLPTTIKLDWNSFNR